MLESGASPEIWDGVLRDYYYDRLRTRYLEPIKAVKNLHFFKCRKPEGEGFAIVAIQCSLVEFLESCFLGINYKRKKPTLPYEYGESGTVFVSFLCNRAPFNGCFTDEALAWDFYDSVRCGVLHEARTKGAWLIHAKSESSLIVDPAGPILYRDDFQEAIVKFIEDYRAAVPQKIKLQQAFIRKFEHLCI